MSNVITRARDSFLGFFEKRDMTAETIKALTQSAPTTEESVMTISTVTSCMDIITGSMAQMPVHLYREAEDGSMEKVHDDYRIKLLNDQSAPNMNAINTRKLMVKDYMLHGEVFIDIEREKEVINDNITVYGDIEKLVHLPAKNVNVQAYHDGKNLVSADFTLTTLEGNNIFFKQKQTTNLNEGDLLRILNNPLNTYQGVGVLKRGEKILSQALDEMEYTSNIYKNGAMPTGVLKTNARLKQSMVDRLRDAWASLYGGVQNSAKTVILEEGMEYEQISLNPDEIQMHQTKKETNSEICKLFGVPESMISIAANKYGSLEQNQLHFLKSTLTPIIVDFENAYNQYLLTEEEKAEGYFFRFDTSELIRTTEKEKIEAVGLGLEKGLLTINEARYKLDLPPIKNDVFMWGLQHALYDPETGEMKVPNMDGGTTNKQKEGVADGKPNN
ncbi:MULTISPECIES: phage portal protein [Bacillus]|uniref:Phage portal protein n=1 Tax=Bacillus cereus TaxID=1396 RepID=A0A162NV00_BACCE|nr:MULTISPECIES: phage portal protein [Bacillus]KZD54552.1 Phage portal protein [Bacillus cereus]TSI10031.1 phage portal protein [Bacillus sp. HY001]